jgi:hypothetical protein
LRSGAYKAARAVLDGGPDLDRIAGGPSSDTIYAQDGERDLISCGGNEDAVYYVAGTDSVMNPDNCERRIKRPAPKRGAF